MSVDFAVELEIGKRLEPDFGLHPNSDSVHDRLVQGHLHFQLGEVGQIEQLLALPYRHSFFDDDLISPRACRGSL